jgi:hypothetical protein
MLRSLPAIRALLFRLGQRQDVLRSVFKLDGSSKPRDQDIAVNCVRAQAAGIKPVLLTLNLVASSTWINAAPAYLANTRAGGGEQHQADRLAAADFETWFYLPNPNVAFPAYEDDYQHPSDAGIALVGPEAIRVGICQ